ncbi:thiamine diphosphokinase [Asaccharospora irregularis DSM 2635]
MIDMKICIVLNGEVENYTKIRDFITKEDYDYIICADGGANHTYYMEITPDYIIGDLDSVDEKLVSYYKNTGVKFEKFPAKKDETDTELCIYLARDLKATRIDFIAALGGRIDHTITNINLLYYLKEMDIIPRIISEKEEMYIAVNEEITISGNVGDIVSVIAINGDADGVTLKNLEYPLDNYYMKYGVPIGMSNVMLSNECKVKVKKGNLIIIKNI